MSEVIKEKITLCLTREEAFEGLSFSAQVKEELTEALAVNADEFSVMAELTYRVLPLFNITNQAFVLGGDVRFVGDVTSYFAKGDSILLYCVSVSEVLGLPSDDDVGGMLSDIIYNSALNKAVTYFNSLLCSRKIFVTDTVEVGSYGLELSQLKPLIEALGNPVSLSSSFYMRPAKTVASIGKVSGAQGGIAHDCAKCTAKYCAYRKDERVTVKIIGNAGQDVVQVAKGALLSCVLADNGYAVNMACTGTGKCGKCAVLITNATVPCKQDVEHISKNLLDKGFRLCCQYKVFNQTIVDMREKAQILSRFEPFSVVADNFAEGGFLQRCDTGYAVAVDLGTTTVSMHLIDTASGAVIGEVGFVNPQTTCGADVIRRVEYSVKNVAGLKQMQSLIVNAINSHLSALTIKKIGVIAISGNTVMQHIIVGEDISSFGYAPYTPKFTEEKIFTGVRLNLNCNIVYVVPSISSFVGGDIVSGLVSQTSTDKFSLLLDLGTNGEIALFNNKEVLVCGTAMGPAFEGVGIDCGMSAVTGAITEVFERQEGYSYSLMGDSPKGLCGSGIISFTSLLLSQAKIDETGRMNCDKIYVTDDIYLSAKDVRQIQLAKAALAAGVETMLISKGISMDDIDKVYLSGGFGNSIKPSDLQAISMLPSTLCAKAVQVGNTSAKGCIVILLSSKCRSKAKEISTKAKFIDLAVSATFKELFVDKMVF